MCPGVTGQLRYWCTKPWGLWGTPYPSAGNKFQAQAASYVYQPICHECTHVPNPEPPSHLPSLTISLGHPGAPAPSILTSLFLNVSLHMYEYACAVLLLWFRYWIFTFGSRDTIWFLANGKISSTFKSMQVFFS